MEVSLHTDFLEQPNPERFTNYSPDQCEHYLRPNVIQAVPVQDIYMELLQRENQELRAQLEAHKIALPLNATNFTSDFITFSYAKGLCMPPSHAGAKRND